MQYSTSGSFGYIGLTTEFCKGSFDSELKVEAIFDPFEVYGILIPSALGKKPRFAFRAKSFTHEEYKAKYPQSQLLSFGFESEFAREGGNWITSNSVTVAQYWTVETEKRKIAQLPDGSVVDEKDVPQGIQPIRTRVEDVDIVSSRLINGVEVLDDSETEWGGSCIPIFPVLGQQSVINGRLKLFSLIRFSRAPQQLINAAKSRVARILSIQPISPWLAVEGQIAGHEPEWRDSNTKNITVLEYKAVTDDGQVHSAPQRQVYEPPIAALSAFIAQETDDVKQSTSIYDSALGEQGNETSGKAITARQRQSSLANFHFIDNLFRALRQLGEAIAELIPKTYDSERQIRILGEDERERVVTVNAQYVDEHGKPRLYDLTAGKYDVRIETGPSYTTKRQETFEMLTQLASSDKNLLNIAGDVFWRNAEVAGHDELSDRYKKFINLTIPGLIEDEEEGAVEIPPQVQQQLQQSGQIIDMATQELEAAQEEIKTLKAKERIELERLAIEREKIASQEKIKLAELGSSEAVNELKLSIDTIKHELDAERAEREAQRQAEEAEASRQHEERIASQQSAEEPSLPAAA